MYSPTILDHFRRPRRFGDIEPADRTGEAHNPLCGDHVRITLRLTNRRIADARFRAEACAICTAAASILMDRIVGMQEAEASAITDGELIGALNARLREQRLRCATLPLEALRSALHHESPDSRTEEEARMTDPKAKGRFVWYDLMTTDPGGAVPFYTSVVGWGTQQWNGGGYTMWTNGPSPIGGVMNLPAEAASAGSPPHWLPYIGTPDTDATAKRAEQLGGKVLKEPTDIPTIGRFAVLMDPQGAVFAVFSPLEDAPGHEGGPAQGDFSWHELATTDYQAAWKFYSDLFGWEKDSEMDMGPAGMYLMFKRNGVTLGGIYNKDAHVPVPNWLCYAKVNDVHDRVDVISQSGGQILVGPLEVPGGDWIVVGTDPQGAAFALHSAKK